MNNVLLKGMCKEMGVRIGSPEYRAVCKELGAYCRKLSDGPTALDEVAAGVLNPFDPEMALSQTGYTGSDLPDPDNPTATDLMSTAGSEAAGDVGETAGTIVSDVFGGFFGGLVKSAWPWLLGAGAVTVFATNKKLQKKLGFK
jgi:hypothetical protein